MSWFFGVIGKEKNNSLHQFGFLPKPLHNFSGDRVSMIAGGISETCFAGTFNESAQHQFTHWIAVGSAIQFSAHSASFLTAKDWETILSASTPKTLSIDGHFVAIRWNEATCELFSDQTGLRTAFLSHTKIGTIVSTRLDWIATASGNTEIDFHNFGPRWIAYNQITHTSILKNIVRLPGGAECSVTSDSHTLHYTPINPLEKKSDGMPEELLRAAMEPALKEKKICSFGLSGGLDSRFLLALLLSQQYPFAVHTFGNIGETDVDIAIAIAKGEHLDQKIFSSSKNIAKPDFTEITQYAAEANLNDHVGTFLRLQHYRAMSQENLIMIDGSFAEFARRQLANRLYIRGSKALFKKDIDGIAENFLFNRGNIFSQNATQEMYDGYREQLRSAISEMPDIHEIGLQNYVDLFTLRTRLPNNGGDEQARLDAMMQNYMPCVQPTYLHAVFQMPLAQKTNARWFRECIRKYRPSLEHYPLVKNNTTYPFRMNGIPAALWTRAKSFIGKVSPENPNRDFLFNFKEEILDIVNSQQCKTYEHYNYQSIRHIAEQYYRGDIRYERPLLWFVTFELWRRNLRSQ